MALTRFRKAGLVAAAAGLTVLAGAGIAGASIPSSSGVFYGCVKGPGTADPGALIVKDDGGTGSITCGSAATEIQWNQMGPQGPAGATGATGTTGATGPAGPSTAGPSGLNVGVYQGGGSAFGYGGNLAVCPQSSPYALGGGGDIGGGSGVGSYLIQDEPAFFNYSTGAVAIGSEGNGTTPNAWFTQNSYQNNASNAYVICSA